jgi:hypothetical protein
MNYSLSAAIELPDDQCNVGHVWVAIEYTIDGEFYLYLLLEMCVLMHHRSLSREGVCVTS